MPHQKRLIGEIGRGVACPRALTGFMAKYKTLLSRPISPNISYYNIMILSRPLPSFPLFLGVRRPVALIGNIPPALRAIAQVRRLRHPRHRLPAAITGPRAHVWASNGQQVTEHYPLVGRQLLHWPPTFRLDASQECRARPAAGRQAVVLPARPRAAHVFPLCASAITTHRPLIPLTA